MIQVMVTKDKANQLERNTKRKCLLYLWYLWYHDSPTTPKGTWNPNRLPRYTPPCAPLVGSTPPPQQNRKKKNSKLEGSYRQPRCQNKENKYQGECEPRQTHQVAQGEE